MDGMAGPEKSNRREFLRGRSAIGTAADLAEQLDTKAIASSSDAESTAAPAPQDVGSDHAGFLIHVSRRAMACEFEVIVNAVDQGRSTEAALGALDLIDRLEDQLTVYRDHSEVSQLNRRAWQEPVSVEAGLFQLLSLAKRIYDETDGAFDITSSSLSRIWGFHRRASQLPTTEEIDQARKKVGSQYIHLDESNQTIELEREGIEINLGGIGKGYALDCAAQQLADDGIDDFLLHGGQSSVLARGQRIDRDESTDGWIVGVGHPLRPDRRLATICLTDQALGTSGSGTQSFHHRGKRYGHILDPRTGWPAEGVLSATVVAPSAAVADALATACYVLGEEGARQLCRQRDDIALLLVERGRRDGSILVHTEGFCADALVLLDEGERLKDE